MEVVHAELWAFHHCNGVGENKIRISTKHEYSMTSQYGSFQSRMASYLFNEAVT